MGLNTLLCQYLYPQGRLAGPCRLYLKQYGIEALPVAVWIFS